MLEELCFKESQVLILKNYLKEFMKEELKRNGKIMSRMKQKNLLALGASFAFYRHREEEFTLFFAKSESLVYCTDVESLIGKLGVPYDSKQWRLFIDSSRASLKAVLLHNNNILPSVPVAHSVQLSMSNMNGLYVGI